MLSNYQELIGTYENPLELQRVSPLRELFKRVITDNKGGEDGYLFKDGHKNTFGPDYFLINLASNPVLTKSDILIGAYLHLRLFVKANNQDGLLYWSAPASEQSGFFFGDSESFWVKDRNGAIWSYRKPVINLHDDLIQYKIKLTHETVIKSLRKLHGCHFITMTTKHGLTVKPEDPKIRSEIRHISIYEEMVMQPVFRHWKPKHRIDLSDLKL